MKKIRKIKYVNFIIKKNHSIVKEQFKKKCILNLERIKYIYAYQIFISSIIYGNDIIGYSCASYSYCTKKTIILFIR